MGGRVKWGKKQGDRGKGEREHLLRELSFSLSLSLLPHPSLIMLTAKVTFQINMEINSSCFVSAHLYNMHKHRNPEAPGEMFNRCIHSFCQA